MPVRILLFATLIAFGTARVGLGQEFDAFDERAQFVPGAAADRNAQVSSPLEAADEQYRLAEQRRRWAFDRQLELLDAMRQRQALAAAPYAGVPALPGYRAGARRVLRRRYAPPAALPWPEYGALIPWGDLPPLPHGFVPPDYPYVQQPIGHERIWTGPNSYIYRPLYAEPFEPAPVEPAPAEPEPLEPEPVEPEPQPGSPREL